MEVFITRSLTKIKKAARGRHPELKAACEKALTGLAETKKDAGRENADQYFEPFKLACESQNASIVEEALDCLQKLIAYGYLRGTARRATKRLDDGEDLDVGGRGSLSSMDAIVGTICACDDFDDDNVQLQVIKALLTAVTSNTCEVHEGSLLIAVRSCYNIHLVTKNQVNKTTAKATLTQMLSIVFQRMEAYDQRTRLAEKEDNHQREPSSSSSDSAGATAAKPIPVKKKPSPPPPAVEEKKNKTTTTTRVDFGVGDSVAVPGFGDGELKEMRSDGSCVVALSAWRHEDGRPALLYAESSVLRKPDPEQEAPQPQVVGKEDPPEGATLRDDGEMTAPTTTARDEQQQPPAQYFDDDDEEDDDEEEDDEVVEDDEDEEGEVPATTTSDTTAVASAAAATAASSPSASQEGRRSSRSLAQATPFTSPYHKDAFLLFRALCKLSMKDQDEVDPPVEPISMQSKALSLELLLSVLEHAGPSFCDGVRFVGAVRQYLCVSLLKNCTSNVTHIVALSLRIFVNLIVKLRVHLKAEVEVFISHIFLRVLDSDNSTHEHKMLVLEVFHNLCTDAHGLVEIFLSYDADFDSVDIFRHIVVALARVVKGRAPDLPQGTAAAGVSSDAARRAAAADASLKRLALSGLVATLRSLAKCCDIVVGGEAAAAAAAATLKEIELAEHLDSPAPSVASISRRPSGSAGDLRQAQNAPAPAPVSAEGDQPSPSSGSADAAAGGPRAGSVESFDLKQRIQEDLREGILQFNMNPKNGIATLARKGHIEMTPESVAKFLRLNANRLDKSKVGDYLGREKEYQGGFCVKVLHCYVDQLDFSNMEFDVAIRHFLSGFRLPGEAQKIDRMMEKFAERYCTLNKSVFPSADVAFVLAFSVIMLQTDLHNPAIKEERRMTKEAFRRNNRGICEGKDLDDDFLDDIFDRIKAMPITLEEDDKKRQNLEKQASNGASASSVFFGANPLRKKAEAFHKEREDMVRSSVTLLRQGRPAFAPGFTASSSPAPPSSGGSVASVNIVSASAAAAPKMFEVAWGPALSAFSHALERLFAGPGPTALALQGLEISACVAAILGLEVARESVINALASFTALHNRATKVLLPRHAACIETLLELPKYDECADALGSSWLPILQVASRVSHFRLLAQGLQTDDAFFAGLDFNYDEVAAKHIAAARQRDVETAKALDALTKLTDSDVDNIYARSTRLSAAGVESFVTQLCAVSAAELSTGDPLDAGNGPGYAATTSSQPAAYYTSRSSSIDDGDNISNSLPPLGSPPRPRVYSLQRLVDVADANVSSRPRLAWDRVWRVLAAHFSRAGAHANADVAKYSVDSLRQLSLKFLCKEELREFSFQRSFLRPFERVFATAQKSEHPNRAPVREYVIECLDALVLSRASSIRSGWRSIFAVYTAAAHDDEATVVELAYGSLDRIVGDHLDLVALDFVELVNCVVAFAAAPRARPQIALTALKRLEECSAALADGRVSTAIRNNANEEAAKTTTPEQQHDAVAEDNDARLELWWPLLLGLAQRVADPRVSVRNGALATLRRTLERDCDSFSPETWRLVFRGVLFPSLESAWTDDAPQPSSTRPTDEAADPTSAPRDDSSWLTSTAPALLETCVALYASRGGGKESAPLLSELLGALGDCVCQDVEALSRLAVDALRMTLDAVAQLEPAAPRETWDVAVNGIASLVRRALPAELREYATETSGLPEERCIAMAKRLAQRLPRAPTIARLVASLRLLPLCSRLLIAAADHEALDEGSLDAMLESLAESRSFAANFDDDGIVRFAFWETKLMGDRPPELVSQRIGAAHAALSALSALKSKPRYRVLAESRLLRLCRDILHEYSESDKAGPAAKNAEAPRRLPPPSELAKAATPLALDALEVVKALDSDTFARHCSWLVPVLSELIVCQSVELRSAVAAVFATRLPTALAAKGEPTTRSVDAQPPSQEHPVGARSSGKGETPEKASRDDVRETPRHPGAVVKPYRLFESQ